MHPTCPVENAGSKTGWLTSDPGLRKIDKLRSCRVAGVPLGAAPQDPLAIFSTELADSGVSVVETWLRATLRPFVVREVWGHGHLSHTSEDTRSCVSLGETGKNRVTSLRNWVSGAPRGGTPDQGPDRIVRSCTETEMLFWRNFRHWLHRTLVSYIAASDICQMTFPSECMCLGNNTSVAVTIRYQ